MIKSVRVQYQVIESYVEQNKANIKLVMEDLRSNPIEGMAYASYYLGEGKFMHLNHVNNEQANPELAAREIFNKFRAALKESGPIAPPKSEYLELVGSNVDIL